MKAEQEYLKAESLSNAVPAEVHLRLADAYLQQKEYEQAYAEMQTYLKIAPDGPLASQTRSLLPQIDSMRKSSGTAPPGKDCGFINYRDCEVQDVANPNELDFVHRLGHTGSAGRKRDNRR